MSDGIENEKKNTNIFLAGMILWYFMSGMEYSLILTTINSYLLSTGAPQKSIGYVFTYFAFSGLISSPIYGHFSDKLKAVRFPILIAMCFSIIGTAIYTLGRNLMLINIGRFVMGLGWGIDGAIVGKVALLKSDAAGIYIPLLLLMRQVGIILGPFWVFWTQHWDFEIMGIKIDTMNSTGLMITFLWCATFAFNVFAVSQEPIVLSTEEKYQLKENDEVPLQENGNIDKKRASFTSQHKYIQVSPLPALTEQIIACLTCSLSGYILQSSLEAMVTPLTKNLLGWTDTQNALLFVAIGVTAVVGYGVTIILSKYCEPRMTLLIGIATEVVVVFLLIITLPNASFRVWWLLPAFLAITIVFIFALPFIVSSSATLMAMFTEDDQQSTIQGIRVAAERVAQICGPLWGAETLHNLYLVFLFPLIYLILSLSLLSSSWTWLLSSQFKKDAELMKKVESKPSSR